jgi:hypothetical protein
MAAAIMKQEIGNRYGRLLVVGGPQRRGRNHYVHCRCDCGVEKEIRLYNLWIGKSKSCGCLKLDTLRARGTRHAALPDLKENEGTRVDRCPEAG